MTPSPSPKDCYEHQRRWRSMIERDIARFERIRHMTAFAPRTT